ncbi:MULTISPECIES: class I SAM-dependent methyltransferase [Caldimonas]|uniref:methyltransferase n=1 Tax=Caldimonas TaxID=196013 RepID=UPI0003636D2F|nr:class I SAM-dependent methyltransferase [Caldimonas manganoxidans]
MHPDPPVLRWTEGGQPREARWHGEAGLPPPKRIVVADDRTTAHTALRLCSEGIGLLWRGDYHNARQLLAALARRLDRPPRQPPPAAPGIEPLVQTFHLQRKAQAEKARRLNLVLLPFEAHYTLPLRRAPEVRTACEAAFGPCETPCVLSLRELLGAIGAHEWRLKGVEVPALGARIHAHYGVFSPVRGEYVDLVARAPLPHPPPELAFDLGTGTGVLAAVLAHRGVRRLVATDTSARAVACARDNLQRLGLADRVTLCCDDLFPAGRAPLIVCNPPWLPGRAHTPLEQAVYDPDHRMLRGFLAGLKHHLTPGGEGWLILSDLAEHLGLRPRAQLLGWIAEAGLSVAGRHDIRPRHPKAADPSDPLFRARRAEVTSLWRLQPRP